MKERNNTIKRLTQKVTKLEQDNKSLAQRNVELSKDARRARSETVTTQGEIKSLVIQLEEEREKRKRAQTVNNAEKSAFKKVETKTGHVGFHNGEDGSSA